jgi:hypothetical protein
MKPRITQLDMFGPKTEEWELHWKGMPEFDQQDLAPVASNTYEFPDGRLYVHFESIEDQVAFGKRLGEALRAHPGRRPEELGREWFSKVVEQDVTRGLAGEDRKRTQSVWWPEAEIGHFAGKAYVRDQPLLPRWPIFVPSKGRSDSRQTMKALDKIGVPYRAVLEEQDVEAYVTAGTDPSRILVLPHKDRGLVVTRNWIWDRAAEEGHRYFWTMDDNIQGFYRLNHNLKVPVGDGTMLRAIEDMAERYENVPVSGMNYFMFASRKAKMPPVYLNGRVYSNMLIQTDFRDPRGNPYRNEGFYNDDTDLCLRIFKDGNCTLLFNAFLIFKSTTMSVKGGMTTHYVQGQTVVEEKWRDLAAEALRRGWYQDPEDAMEDPARLVDGRWRMAAELAAKHPDVTKISRKWGRWQHVVDYSGFRKNKLHLREGVAVPEATNNFGMALRVEQLGSQAPPAPSEQTSPPRTVTVTTRADLEIKPARTVHVHFESEEDVQAFAALVDQRLTSETRTCWWPKMELKIVEENSGQGPPEDDTVRVGG